MAYSLMTSKKLRGMTVSEARKSLGDFDGHYFSESYPPSEPSLILRRPTLTREGIHLK